MLDSLIDTSNLIQKVTLPTLQHIINGRLKESIFDYVYLKDLIIAKNVMGDHCLIIFDLLCKANPPEITLKRGWRIHTKELLCTELQKVNIDIETDDLQSTWN